MRLMQAAPPQRARTRLAKLGVGGAAHASRCASSLRGGRAVMGGWGWGGGGGGSGGAEREGGDGGGRPERALEQAVWLAQAARAGDVGQASRRLEQRPSRDRDALRIASPRADASPVAAAASTHSRASSASASAYEIKAIASAAMPRHGAACGGMAAIRRRSLLHESIVRDAGKASACGVSTKRGGGAAAWRYGSGGSGLRARGDGDVRSLLETSTRGASPSRAPAGGCAEDRSSMHSLSCDRRLSTDCLDFVCLGRCAPPAAPPGWTSAQGFIS